jgi:FMN reductase
MDFEDRRLIVVGIGGTLREGSTCLAALRRALGAAEEAGAKTELLELREVGLPMYEPGLSPEEYGENVGRFTEAVRGADEERISPAAYHGTLAFLTKNALDYMQYLARGERSYLDGRVVDLNYGRRLDRLCRLAVELAQRVNPAGSRRVETVGIAV